ncbi:hypothetical protein Q1695_003297 [Nippostrongylus brasiliensis]|nr:hypothetical protein Q1695_003297 [Nippostrongylus brasiliensis]
METSEFVVQAAPHRLEQRRRTAMWIAALVPLSGVTGDNALSSSTVVFDNETNLLNSGGNGTADAVSTHIEAFPNVIKTSFFISAVTTVCVLLSCSFIIGIYEVHDRKKKRTVKSHT